MIASVGQVQAQEANAVYVDQVGDASQVTILQEGYRNRIGESADLRALLGGAGGKVTINQTGNDNILSRSIMMEDSSNLLVVKQRGDANAYNYGRIVGSNNAVRLTQTGTANAAITWVKGEANLLSVLQEGRDNAASLSAAGSDNRLTSWSKGDRNQIEMSASGSRNTMTVTQQGVGHAVAVSTTGAGATLSITQR